MSYFKFSTNNHTSSRDFIWEASGLCSCCGLS